MSELELLRAIRIRTPRLELRLPAGREELVALAKLAEAGIHPPDEMPFGVAWTDRLGSPGWLDEFLAFHESALKEFRREDWTLNLLTFAGGELAGTQAISSEHYEEGRTVSTGSWLGQAFQGRGIGTEMRAAVLAFAFDGLGAAAAESGALLTNAASQRVSAKLGYAPGHEDTLSPRGEPLPHRHYRLERPRWRPSVRVELSGVEACRPLLGASAQ